MKSVTIVHRRLTHYRVPFFNQLRDKLGVQGVRLRLLHGHGTPSEERKKDGGRLNWAEPLATHYLLGGRLCWQGLGGRLASEDLVVITQENALLANQILLLRRPRGRIAFWGHGGNLQGKATSLRERYKRWTTRQVDWWFAYTELSKELVRRAGFPDHRITCLNNSIDMSELRRDLESISPEETAKLRAALGLSAGPTALFLGSLHAHKRLDFLIAAAEQLRLVLPGFQLVIVGAGPKEAFVSAKVAEHSWLVHAGARHGREKALFLTLGDVMLNPGAVGLGILDAFAAGLPLVTTDCGLHGPEIAYLSEVCGIMTPNRLDCYVGSCLELFTTPERLSDLAAGSRAQSAAYNLENMVRNFAEGVHRALEAQA